MGDPLLACAVDAERAVACSLANDPERAHALAQTCLETRLRLLGAQHPDTAAATYHVAVTGIAMGGVTRSSAARLLPLIEASIDLVSGVTQMTLRLAFSHHAHIARDPAAVVRASEAILRADPPVSFANPALTAANAAMAHLDLENWAEADRMAVRTFRYLADDDDAVFDFPDGMLGFIAELVPPSLLVEGDAATVAALRDALHRVPMDVLSPWVRAVGGEQNGTAVARAIADELAEDDFHATLIPALFDAAAELFELAPEQLPDWLGTWKAALSAEQRYQPVLIAVSALLGAYEGEDAELRTLPPELRQVVARIFETG